MRTSIRPAVFAATALTALSLTLTACGSDGSKDEQAASKAVGAGKKGSAANDEAGQGKAAAEATESGSSGSGTAPPTRPGAMQKTGGKAPACTVGDVKISAGKQDGVPTTHITLTATNVSGHACTLLRYPLIAFGDIQTAKDVPAVAKSKPGTAVVVAAGGSAYAAVRLNQGGVHEENRVVTSFNVNLFAADGPAEGSKVVTAPAGGIAVDDAVAKTGYWTPELRNGADEF
ncbi:DUF4232 domain-containing protein [Streptomyces sp. NRRL B-1677]|uniref:DUF4232 domain-containing protein n=1 Tax=Streptomyces klenkii TaxID=1420899 RepID=A0A3B0BW97_9ACTN|nr:MULTISPECIES: DUF4232 domain-containing protein [Streptomyces]MBF6048435.1 DUF4232 domain-containing protein [Streptomyces sp. NRRL B-1677]RKN77675.1 DUF4232 domain-containing protein [Streptomyces klenkii]